MQIYY